MIQVDIEEFIEFARDHIKHFDAVPMEFEDSTGNVIGPVVCWNIALKYGLTKQLEREEKCRCGNPADLYGACYVCHAREENRRYGKTPPVDDTPSLGEDPMQFHK